MRSGPEYLRSKEKRWLDILGGTALAVGLSPAAAVAAVGVCIEDRLFNPIFSQARIGRNSELFNVQKLRTIRRVLTEGQEFKAFGTSDPRATRFGQILRKSAIDEYPQLFSVLRGDMSLVGIRPVAPEVNDELEAANPDIFPRWKWALGVAPGLTGLSQLGRRAEVFTPVGYRSSMVIDADYPDMATLKLDLEIIRDTPGALLVGHLGRGAIQGTVAARQEPFTQL